MDIFELLLQKQSDWGRMAYNMLRKYDTYVCSPDDLVSDMYIKMHSVWGADALKSKNESLKEGEELITIQDVMYGEEINSLYVYRAMNSVLMNRLNKEKRYLTESHIAGKNTPFVSNDIVDSYLSESMDANDDVEVADREILMKEFLDDVMKSLDGMYWFDAKLIKVYLLDNHSMRSLADKSKISLTTIFHNLKSTKTKLKVEFMPDYIVLLKALGEVDEAARVEKEYSQLLKDMEGSQIDIFQVIKEEEKK